MTGYESAVVNELDEKDRYLIIYPAPQGCHTEGETR